MDLSSIKPQTRTIDIHFPGDETKKLGVLIELRSINDPEMKRIKRKIQDEKSKLDQRGKILKAESIEENANEIIFQAILGWQWYNPTGNVGDKGYDESADATFRGKKPEFNRASVLAVLNEPGLDWFANQISEAIGDEKAFFDNSKSI